MSTELLLQRTPEWYAARAGSLGSSQIADAIRRTKSGWGASRANLMADLLVERLTGKPKEGYVSKEMQWGIDNEPLAVAEYEFQNSVEIEVVGLVRHPRIKHAHASPYALVGEDGLVEFKCPNTATHLETLISGDVDRDYIHQMQWQMACSGRRWCDFISFDPRVPQKIRMFTKRCFRDPVYIESLEAQAEQFLKELDVKLGTLAQSYGLEIAA